MSENVFLLPDLGEGLTEATVLEWAVAPGEEVSIDQVVVEVETAKASVEVPIPFAGIVTTLHGAPGETLLVGQPLITVASAEQSSAIDRPDDYSTHRDEERAGSGNVLIGYGTSESVPRRRRRTSPTVHGTTDQPRGGYAGGPVRVISPIVRSLIQSHELDLEHLAEKVGGHVITRAAVEQAIAEAASPSAPAISHAPDSSVIPLKGFRKAVADRLSASRHEIPDATTWVDVDATELLNARRMINIGATEDNKISLMSLLARLAVVALKQFPELNATVDTARGEITQYNNVHLGIAAQTPRGLVVPVIRDADQLSTLTMELALRETIALAREGKLGPNRLSGGTFTLNNYGVFGVDGSTPIINHPQAAILGIGRIIDRPWVRSGEITTRNIAQVSLSFDHRVADGGAAGGYLRTFADYIENPVIVLGQM